MKINLDFIRSERDRNNLTLIEMSTALGFKNASTYLKYENGDYIFKANNYEIGRASCRERV